MSNPVLRAFFFGRALAEVLNEKAEETFTNTLSELGKFDAEQRERLRQFMDEVQAKADQQAAKENATASGEPSGDLQEEIDELRAEIARLRAELKNFRNEPV
jgi:predicted RNase H-like nuclease (RuvC/YqgF family)